MPQDLAEIYRTTYRALVRFLYRKVWDAARAEDLAQEAFARAVVHKPARERRHLTLLKAEPQSEPAADDGLHAETERTHVRAALERLTPRDREVLLLWDSGLSYDEIAAQTGLARGAIGTTLARARRRLVEAYEAGRSGEHVARG